MLAEYTNHVLFSRFKKISISLLFTYGLLSKLWSLLDTFETPLVTF